MVSFHAYKAPITVAPNLMAEQPRTTRVQGSRTTGTSEVPQVGNGHPQRANTNATGAVRGRYGPAPSTAPNPNYPYGTPPRAGDANYSPGGGSANTRHGGGNQYDLRTNGGFNGGRGGDSTILHEPFPED